MKIKKPFITWEEFEGIVGGAWTPSAHTHVMAEITDLAFASIPDFGDWIDQAVKEASSPTFVTAKLTDLTDGYVPYHIDDATGLANSPIFTDGTKVGIGTATIPHGGIGWAKFALEGPNADVAGPHIQITTALDDYPLVQLLFYSHDDIEFMFDAYWDGAYKSSDAGSNFNLLKLSDTFRIQYDSGVAQGGGITWNNGIVLDVGGQVGIGKIPAEKFDVDGTVKATLFEGNIHWDYITNEPAFYPPEYHYHVGKDIVSLHLVDLDDTEAEDIFDVLPTAAIHGQGNYDWWGMWDTTAAANTSAEVVVLAGDDKMLRLTDNSNTGDVETELTADPGHVMVTGVMEFRIRQSATNKRGWILFLRDAQQNMGIYMSNDGDMYLLAAGASHQILTYAADTWYKIRIHYDCVARACVLFVDNVFEFKKDLAAGASGDFVNNIQVRTFAVDTGYTLDINKLKVFNLTI